MTPPERDVELEELLDYLKRTRGFNFGAYKRSTLERRISRRMAMAGVKSYDEYQDYLEVHPDEFAELFNTILINTTAFFRDMGAWAYLRAEVLPTIAGTSDGGPRGEPIRVWSAGCASGEEAYTLAILWAELLGIGEARRLVKIYATDVDADALNQARIASYGPRAVQSVPPDLLAKYFTRANGGYVFHPELRRMVIFGRHDLLQDAPISRVDLLVCRNTLMYFNTEAQSSIVGRFRFALAGGGYLFLGRAETLITRGNTLTPASLQNRVFKKTPSRTSGAARALLSARRPGTVSGPAPIERLIEAAYQTDPTAQIVVDPTGAVVVSNERAAMFFGLTPGDMGRPLQNLDISRRLPELGSWIERAYAQDRAVHLHEIPFDNGGDTRFFEGLFLPLRDADGSLIGIKIAFQDVTLTKHLQDELENTRREEELTYEELQSTNEELETTNEELQSANEELETTNEELQSTNEELQATNEELRALSVEVDRTTGFLRFILTSMRGAVIVLDRELRVLLWSHAAVELWGLREEEAQGQHFPNLDIGLPTDALLSALHACLYGDADVQELTLSGTNRRGRHVELRVTCTPLGGSNQEVRGVILLME